MGWFLPNKVRPPYPIPRPTPLLGYGHVTSPRQSAESPLPSHLCRVTSAESPLPSHLCRVNSAESTLPSHLCRVTSTESEPRVPTQASHPPSESHPEAAS
jgi:hypothetical protein